LITLEIRLFNKPNTYATPNGFRFELTVPKGITFPELLEMLGIPDKGVFLAFRNGRNINLFQKNDSLENGEVIALAGPYPTGRVMARPLSDISR